MSLLSPIACMMGRHEPKRRKVEWDGKNYSGHCKHCGKPIERVTQGNWREIPPEDVAKSE